MVTINSFFRRHVWKSANHRNTPFFLRFLWAKVTGINCRFYTLYGILWKMLTQADCLSNSIATDRNKPKYSFQIISEMYLIRLNSLSHKICSKTVGSLWMVTGISFCLLIHDFNKLSDLFGRKESPVSLRGLLRMWLGIFFIVWLGQTINNHPNISTRKTTHTSTLIPFWGQATAFFSTPKKSKHKGPLSPSLSEAILMHTHFTCLRVFPRRRVPVSWLALTFSLTWMPSNNPYFAQFFLSCGNHTMAVISQHIWLAGLIILIASYSASKWVEYV